MYGLSLTCSLSTYTVKCSTTLFNSYIVAHHTTEEADGMLLVSVLHVLLQIVPCSTFSSTFISSQTYWGDKSLSHHRLFQPRFVPHDTLQVQVNFISTTTFEHGAGIKSFEDKERSDLNHVMTRAKILPEGENHSSQQYSRSLQGSSQGHPCLQSLDGPWCMKYKAVWSTARPLFYPQVGIMKAWGVTIERRDWRKLSAEMSWPAHESSPWSISILATCCMSSIPITYLETLKTLLLGVSKLSQHWQQ